MLSTYKAILNGNQVKWSGEAPQNLLEGQGVAVHITILEEPSLSSAQGSETIKKPSLISQNNIDIYGAKNTDELRDVYERWAIKYDEDNEILETVTQPTAVNLFKRYVSNFSAKILDVGCGTGLVGEELIKAGYTCFDGLDLSKEMLSFAKNRGYGQLFHGNLNETLPFEDETYDATICVGTFTHSHVKADRLSELIRITRPGGFVCFTVHEGVFDEYNFNNVISSYVTERKWKILEKVKLDYMKNENVKGWYIIATILPSSLTN